MTNQEIVEKVSTPFAGLVGQSSAKKRRVAAWSAYALGENPESAFFRGAAGLGKTAMMKADIQAAKIAAEIRGEIAEPKYFDSAGSLRRNGEEFSIFMGDALDAKSGALFVYLDEMHELFPSTVQSAKIVQMVKGLTDSQRGDVRRVSFGDEGDVTRHASQVAFVCGTNFPHKVKDYDAIVSRLGGIDLDLYTTAELCEIASLLAKKSGLTINEETLAMMARCGRGTARPVEKMIASAKREAVILGKSTLNRAEIVGIMRDLSLYPRGLARHEIIMLAMSEKDGYIKKQTIATALAIENATVADSLAFLQGTGFVHIQGSQYTITKEGRDYLASIHAAKFVIPSLSE